MTELYAPKGYFELSPTQKSNICNGCGTRGKFDFCPDTIWGLDVSEACNIHDFMYHFAEHTIEAKQEADRAFLNNMLRLIDGKSSWWILKKIRRNRAMKYYELVDAFGGPAFWNEKNSDAETINV